MPAYFQYFSGTFGPREDDANTDGVAFAVTSLGPDSANAVLWDRLLDPLHATPDHGPKSFSIVPRAGGEKKIILQPSLGSHTNTDWDWSSVANLRFKPAIPLP